MVSVFVDKGMLTFAQSVAAVMCCGGDDGAS